MPTSAPTTDPTALPTSAPSAACHCLSINKDGSVAKLCPRCVAKNCKTTDATVHCAVLHKNDQVALQFKKAKKSKKTKKKKPVKSSCHCLAINKDGSLAKLCPRCVAKNCKTTDAKVHCAPPTKEPTAAPTMVPTAMPTSAPTAACHCLSINKDGSVAKLCPRCVAKNCKTTDATVHCAVLHKN